MSCFIIKIDFLDFIKKEMMMKKKLPKSEKFYFYDKLRY